MNCQRFEEIASDIAREQILDASVRTEAFAHCHGCGSCAVRLEEELAITDRLRNFAVKFDSIGAPARVEARVLAAFEQGTLTAPQPVAIMSRQRYWISAISSIAALVLIVFALSTIRSRQAVPATGKTDVASIAEAVRANPISSSLLALVTGQNDRNQASIPVKRTSTIRHRRNAKSTTNQSKPTGYSEIATDFLPVSYGGSANLADGGRMVRVELPRSAMASFGLPVNMDRANERVKADVLLGVDGLAHAIRFVQRYPLSASNIKK